MLRLVVRRARVQRLVLSAAVVLIALAATLMGICTLLLGVTSSTAFHVQVQRLQPHEVDVTAYVVGLPGSDLEATRRDARGVVRHVLAPLQPSLVSTTTSRLRQFGGPHRLGYLATTDAIARQVALTSGRFPRDGTSTRVEAVAPEAAARNLHLRLGDRVVLGSETGLGASARPVTMVIVGTFRASSRAAWTSDPLSGAGFETSYSDGSSTAPTYGPFMVGRTVFDSTGSNVDGLRVDAHPALREADETSLEAAVDSLGSASGLLSERVDRSARISRVASELPDTLSRLQTQRSTTRSAVQVVLVLSTTLALAALLLAGRLVADTRVEERELLVALGLGRAQQLVAALVEAALLAAVAAVLALPAAAFAHSAMTHLPGLEAAGLAQGPTVTRGLVLTVLVGAALLTVVLTVSPLVTFGPPRLPVRQRALARSGVDVFLLVVAGVSWWALHSRSAAAVGDDVLLTLAPVLFLSTVALVAVRLLPPVLGLAAAAGSRSRALLPLALRPVVLRLGAGAALVLLTTASAAATFGVALHSTWERSQDDQADLRVGTGLSLTLSSPPTAEDGAAVARGSGQGSPVRSPDVSPVTDRPVALGSFVGDTGDPPQLVALDTRQAGAQLRGRLPVGASWAGVGRELSPRAPVRGAPLPADSRVELTGRAPAGVAISVTPRVVLQDAVGLRSTLDAATITLDGRSHPLRWSAPPAPGQRIVALQLTLADGGNSDSGDGALADVSVVLRVPGSGAASGVRWHAHQLGQESPVLAAAVEGRRAGDDLVLTTRARVNLSYLAYGDGQVLATAFAPPASVPVAVSRDLVEAVGTRVGGSLSATVGVTALELHVVRIVPTVPSAPGRVAVLADIDTLSRGLIGAGGLDPVVDAFWVSRPTAETTSALGALKLGEVTTRSEVAADLSRGPLQVTVPLAYLTLVGSAALLLLAGAVLLVSGDPRRRSDEVARLRALGLTRWGARRLLVAEHAALLVPLVVVGVLVGAAAATALGTSLVRSDQGTAPVPGAALVWPWAAEGLLTGGLLAGCLLVAAVAASVQVRRSDTSRLRTGE